MNSVQLVGRLGKDPELKYLPSGSAVTNFSIATNKKWKDKNGKLQEQTHWHSMVAFGKTAETISKYLHKGDVAGFVGELQQRVWDDKDGNKRYATDVLVNKLHFVGGNKKQESAPQVNDFAADDIPF